MKNNKTTYRLGLLFLALILGFALFSSPHDSVASATVGNPAPAFFTQDSNGLSIGKDQFAGKYVVLEWTNKDCPFVQKHYKSGNMQKLQKTYTGKGVVWLSVISSAEGKQGYLTGAEANKVAQENGSAATHILLDPKGDMGRAYGAKTTPHMFIFDPNGNLIYQGGIDSINSTDPADIEGAQPYVMAALDEALAGKPVTTPVSRPYGCSVKY